MSGGGNVTSLEEFFLRLREFDPQGAPPSRFELDEVWVTAAAQRAHLPPPSPLEHLFLAPTFGQLQEPEISPLEMNRPIATVLAFAPQTPAARQRAIAAIGGIAAAVLVVVGVTTGPPQRPGSGPSQQALSRNGGPHLPPLDAAPSERGASTGVTARQAADRVHGAAGGPNETGVHGSFSVFVGAAAGDASPAGGSAPPGTASPSGGSSVAPALPSVNPVATALDPVTQLTSNVGSTVSTTVQQINAAVPAAAPITGVVNNVGTSVSSLSGMLAAPNA
jgi:hypothetical protein